MTRKAAIHGTTILAVRRGGKVAIGGDGQVTLGDTVIKQDAAKIRKLREGKVVVGFAGATADAFALLERFDTKLHDFQGNVARAAAELAKQWRTDRVLRRLEAMLVVINEDNILLLSGTGDIIEPSDGILGIGSGGSYAVAAARALTRNTEMSAADVVRESLKISGEICIYSNQNIIIEELAARDKESIFAK